MRPCGPEPCTLFRSRLASFARRRAKGEAKMRLAPAGRALSTFCAVAAGARGVVGVCAVGADCLVSGFFGASALEAAGALTLALAAAFTSSPSFASTAMTEFTATSWVPSGMTILASVPSSTASYSMVALSVSISAITSPDLILSPSFLSHLARLPFSIVGDSAGMRMLVGIVRLPVTNGLRRLDDFGHRGKRQLFKIGGVGHRHIFSRHARDRRIQIVKSVCHHAGSNFGADTALLPALLHSNQACRLLNGGHYGFGVHWLERTQIDHLGVDTFFRQFFGGLEGIAHTHRP